MNLAVANYSAICYHDKNECVGHESKYSVDKRPLAVSELLLKLFPGVENLFPRGSFEIIGIVSCLSLNQLTLTRRPRNFLRQS